MRVPFELLMALFPHLYMQSCKDIESRRQLDEKLGYEIHKQIVGGDYKTKSIREVTSSKIESRK